MAGMARRLRKTAKNVQTGDNDDYSFAVDDLVPARYGGTQRYLDVHLPTFSRFCFATPEL
jgi:hypothetical protein